MTREEVKKLLLGVEGCDEIRLSTYRHIISDFIFTLTRKNIPVQFHTKENFTDGKTIHLSIPILKKSDFDCSIGIVLHEASHILLTDFNVINSIFSKVPIIIPHSLKEKCKEKNLSDENIYHLCKWVWNYIEDRFIDNNTLKNSPEYFRYYESMYKKLWNNETNSKALKSRAFRIPNMASYKFRVITLTNQSTDFNALKGLKEISELININDIFRLKNTNDRIDLGYKVCEIIVDNITKI